MVYPCDFEIKWLYGWIDEVLETMVVFIICRTWSLTYKALADSSGSVYRGGSFYISLSLSSFLSICLSISLSLSLSLALSLSLSLYLSLSISLSIYLSLFLSLSEIAWWMRMSWEFDLYNSESISTTQCAASRAFITITIDALHI